MIGAVTMQEVTKSEGPLWRAVPRDEFSEKRRRLLRVFRDESGAIAHARGGRSPTEIHRVNEGSSAQYLARRVDRSPFPGTGTRVQIFRPPICRLGIGQGWVNAETRNKETWLAASKQ